MTQKIHFSNNILPGVRLTYSCGGAHRGIGNDPTILVLQAEDT
jgi:hypothetical protein